MIDQLTTNLRTNAEAECGYWLGGFGLEWSRMDETGCSLLAAGYAGLKHFPVVLLFFLSIKIN